MFENEFVLFSLPINVVFHRVINLSYILNLMEVTTTIIGLAPQPATPKPFHHPPHQSSTSIIASNRQGMLALSNNGILSASTTNRLA